MKNTILEFKSTNLTQSRFKFLSIDNKGKYFGIPSGKHYSLNECLKGNVSVEDGSYFINKIKRESDGEIFAIGDSVIYTGLSTIYNGKSFEIKNFDYREFDGRAIVNYIADIELITKTDLFIKEKEISHLNRRVESIKNMINVLGFLTGNDLIAVKSDFNEFNVKKHTKAFEANPIKIPLFKTETGKDIFEKDNYYTVHHKKTQISISFEVFGPFMASVKPTADIKYFSSKDEAEEWIIQNKPMFSMKELLQFERAPIHVIRSIAIDKLKENA